MTEAASYIDYQAIFWKGVSGFVTNEGGSTSSSGTSISVVTQWGTSVSWYTTGDYANRQLNESSMTYAYVAIG